ncbi:hypothetical protein GLOIN_2v1783684 [Rhizophagus irregularis DAOM 181602=DAOM 197198]|uniref:Crinkler family protein n=1 Tax=Rhizophagus irregularis (strain DAOM 181602 / DAOM 197198 / MUCL 43194) TaxID=747089 RepID=A0A2P4PEF2_RHIID|nr:hypothetical protein GLOIN_2v1783684 [Rhizophagus irregularis DAOM 181602=DAOM 197198]POG63773.1 hypothetical protein GLOIN_2v1783684 [Rhizophagus irregularis DAOM 181602=DAOM 197198]|eukprot:XP_025170639.1 hypothetical protein GLOIN_2v1783684 [Rhizophagus irregularis DAOM 181602=DAOM 197198]
MKILYFSVIVDAAIVVSNNNINQDDIQVSHIKSLVFNEISEKLKSLNINNFASLKLWKVDGKKPVAAGGLGGTTHRRLEAASSMKRESTISKPFECLLKERIILIRSPPMTGKTSLGQLLEDKLLKLDEVQDGSACVFRISLCKKIYRHEIHELHHGGSIFWDAFKYITQSSQLCIVELASYGHYGAYATSGSRSDMDISSVNNLSMKNKWGYEDICFTKEEFHDYFHNFLHPGLVAYTMNHIAERYTKKERNSLSFNVFSFLKFHDFNDLIKKRGLPYNSKDITYGGRLLVFVDTSPSQSDIALHDFPAPLL